VLLKKQLRRDWFLPNADKAVLCVTKIEEIDSFKDCDIAGNNYMWYVEEQT
jgi:hypothetical protein